MSDNVGVFIFSFVFTSLMFVLGYAYGRSKQ